MALLTGPQRAPLGHKIDVEVHEQVREFARATRRTVSGALEHLLIQGLKREHERLD